MGNWFTIWLRIRIEDEKFYGLIFWKRALDMFTYTERSELNFDLSKKNYSQRVNLNFVKITQIL